MSLPIQTAPFHLSVLDQAPIAEGSGAGQAPRNSLHLARLADDLGYFRYWVAEHLGIPAFAMQRDHRQIGKDESEMTRRFHSAIFLLVVLMPSLTHAQARQPTTKPMANSVEIQFVFPGSRSLGQPSSHIEPAAGREILALHAADGTKITALFAKSLNTKGLRPTVIYFYGNGMCMADSLPIFDRFRGLGFNVLMADYQGYGLSDGAPSEAGCYATADALYDYLLSRKDIDPRRILSTGWSLGGAVAIDLASRKPVAGLATFSAFTSIPDMSRVLSERFPLAMLVKSKFDNLTKIKSVTCPIFIAHGSADPLVPFAMMGKLKTAAKAKVTAVPVKDAGHNDLFEIGGDGLFNRFKTFVNQLPGQTSP